MESKTAKRAPDLPLSESTISPSLTAIRERCRDLFDTNGFIQYELVDGENDDDANPEGAYDPYDHKKTGKDDKKIA